ncbi:sugar transferase [Rhodovulum sp. MB263]|uniref:sugar transferase n=1 Tax=Rhodovulum sp. (strain MB263) TaxID=308754 RepID=UPI0009B7BC75|nr:sugar transferase [Rhodovulum sp. MB263]ARC88752.1 hypothetical protein B5V46_09035 [Rhodovulum sp. MB263]
MNITLLQVPRAEAGAMPTERLGGYRGKRAFDLLVAALLLTLTAPLMLAIWLLLRAGTGQGFACHRRIGHGGRPIRCLVFHLGRRDGEVAGWVRRAGLSGLPLLWSVLRGEMSLVGPRPATPAVLARYGLARNGYLAMRPGLTGLADAREGAREGAHFCDRVHDDLRYSRIASLALDLGLIAATLRHRCTRRPGRPQPGRSRPGPGCGR